jgi:hypothetical protein
MTKRYHAPDKIFFSNPYVIRVSYSKDIPESTTDENYRKVVRQAYKLIKGTWGHTALEYESFSTQKESPPAAPAFTINSLFDSNYVLERRGYFCFKDEMDALQFRLSIDTNSVHVHMWPSERKFTIHEYIEPDES